MADASCRHDVSGYRTADVTIPEKELRVVHILGGLTHGGLQLRVLNLMKELPSFSHVLVFESEDRGVLYDRFAKVCDVRQCVRGDGRPLDFVRRLAGVFRETSPDVVLAHLFGNHTLVSWAASLARVPATYAVSANDPIYYSGSRWQPMALAQAARPFCRGEVAVSETVGRVLTSRLHLPASRVTVIPNGCPVEAVAACAAAGRDGAAREGRGIPRILMAASIGRMRDHSTVLRAIRLLRDQGRPVEMWFAGAASSKHAQVQSLTDELGVRDLVRFLGVRDDVPELMGASDILVHSTNTEGLGMTMLEGMAAGVPIIASDIPLCREVLDGGRCGLVFPLGDAPALAAAIRRLLDDEPLRCRLVDAASERVRAKYHAKRMAADYAELLRGAASDRKPSPSRER